jgi:methylornithine synthase
LQQLQVTHQLSQSALTILIYKLICHMPRQLSHILRKADREENLTREEIAFLLSLDDKSQLACLFQAARKLRQRFFGDKVFLYGFLYLSTYCRNDCRFCYYRRSNSNSLRYRRNLSEILAAANEMAASGVHLIDLTMGEDPIIYDEGRGGKRWLVNLISEVRQASDRPVMVSAGVIPNLVLADMAQAGASWYACYQETFNRQLFGRLRPRQQFGERLLTKQQAQRSGLLVEEGLLCGVGESIDDLVHAIVEMGRIGASQMRAMTFVPQPGTPMADRPEPDGRSELVLMAVMRLVYPRVLIPASLDVEGLAGLKSRLEAGANVVTSIVPPGMGLAGVAHPTKDIGAARRTPQHIESVLFDCRLRSATADEYRVWLDSERQNRVLSLNQRNRSCA